MPANANCKRSASGMQLLVRLSKRPVSSEVDLQLAKVATQGVAKATLFV